MRYRLLKKLFLKVWRRDPILLEVFIGWEALVLGITLLYPLDTFSTSITYKFLSEIACEATWGIWITLLSIAYFLALMSKYKKIRLVALFCITAFWGFIAAGFYIGNYAGTGWPLQLGFVIGAIYCILNLDVTTT